MKLTFFANADAAIRASYAHGSPNSFFDNTIWSQIPSRLTKSDYDALGTCLPMYRRRVGLTTSPGKARARTAKRAAVASIPAGA
jgi:hypothetical protein